MRLLLEAAPAAALAANAAGELPLHAAACGLSTEAVWLLLKAAPEAADGSLPLHLAADGGSVGAARLLVEAAPAAATVEAGDEVPLEIALSHANQVTRALLRARYLEIARLLLPATPPGRALPALLEAGEVGLPLFADLAACTALSHEQWQRVPAPCPALGTALPAVLARSAAEAALLVGRLPAEARQRLRTGALCLVRAQRERRTALPAVLVGQVLALAAGP